MTDDRLAELLRQRALVREHLAWLDREIATASGSPDRPDAPVTPPAPQTPPASFSIPASRPAPPPPQSRPQPGSPALSGAGYLASQAAAIARQTAASRAEAAQAAAASSGDESPLVNATADAILQEYRTEPGSVKEDVRKGCFLYFFAALALVAAGVIALYFLISKR